MQDLKDLKSRLFQKRFRRREGENPANPKSGHLCRKTCRDVFIVDVTLQILIQTPRGIAGDRPPRYGNRTVSSQQNGPLHRRARACPSPCLGLSNNRGGQAPALR